MSAGVNASEQWLDAIGEVAHDAVVDLAESYPDERTLVIDLEDLDAVAPGLAEDVMARPDDTTDTAEEALAAYPEHADIDGVRRLGMARVRFANAPDEHSHVVGTYSPSRYIGRTVAVRGQITKRTEVEPRIDMAAFECVRCGTLTRINQPSYGSIREPHECQGCETQGPYRINDTQSEWQDYQKIRIQQPPEDAAGETKHIDAHVHDDLTGHPAIEGGRRVTVLGQLEPVRRKGNVVHERMLVATGIESEQQALDDLDVKQYRDEIQRIKDNSDSLGLLADSLAPSVQGYPLVKRALILQIVGSFPRTGPDGNYHRGDSHVYLIGDPGVGKTLLLDAISDVVPRSVMTDGTGSSAAGLTASITQDDFSDQQWSIEAGTLVRAHDGLAIVDELDKGEADDLQALHTALESQQVHVSKAGKNATLPAKAALLAAGNPVGGHFDPTKDFVDEVELQSPLLSRFDLIFTIREDRDESEQREIAETVIESRQDAGALDRGDDDVDADEITRDIDADPFAAYVAAARQRVKPVATEDAQEQMEEWYVNLKTKLPSRYSDAIDESGDYEGPPLPVTARKLDALQRLAEAHARVRFSSAVTIEDVKSVIPMIERSLADIGIEPKSNAALGKASIEDTAEVGI